MNQQLIAQAFNNIIPKFLEEKQASSLYDIEWITFDGRMYGSTVYSEHGGIDYDLTTGEGVNHYSEYKYARKLEPKLRGTEIDSLWGEHNAPVRIREISTPDDDHFFMAISFYGRPTREQLNRVIEITQRSHSIALFAEHSIWAIKCAEKIGAVFHAVQNKKLVGFD